MLGLEYQMQEFPALYAVLPLYVLNVSITKLLVIYNMTDSTEINHNKPEFFGVFIVFIET